MPFESVVFGERRSPVVTALLDSLGRDRTAVVVYLLQRSWDWLVAATAFTPVFIWLLGSTAAHAAARLMGVRGKRIVPMLVLFGYATALTRIPSDLVSLALPLAAGLVGVVSTIWLAVIAWRGIGAHYALDPQRALAALAFAVVLFYLAPLAIIVGAIVAILVAAIVLEYVPPL